MDTKVLPDGSVEFQVGSEREAIRSEVASAFISNLLAKMQNHSKQTGDFTPLGGAVIYPDAITIEIDQETGDPRLRLGFGKALLVMSLPKGEMKKLAEAISKV
jgi:hypothetical protein